MNRLNVLFSLASLSVVLVTIERYSFTTKVLLQPHSFLRLHELVQMTVLILITFVLPFFLLREVSNNFEGLKTPGGFLLALVFVVGGYFYATGNGLHEVSSFNLNQFCNVKDASGELCNSFFFNDYYTGNILYFVGGALIVVSLLLLESRHPHPGFTRRDMAISMANAVVYALAIFAYAAFDRVTVGLVYTIAVMLVADALYLSVRRNSFRYPVTTYTAATYTLGTLLAIVVRLR